MGESRPGRTGAGGWIERGCGHRRAGAIQGHLYRRSARRYRRAPKLRDVAGQWHGRKWNGRSFHANPLPRENAEPLLHLSQLYRATSEPTNAASAIDRAIEALQRAQEPYDLPLFVAEQAESQGALGNLHVADRLYDRATDLIEGLLVNA